MDVVDLTKALVSHNTVSTISNVELTQWIAGVLETLGFEVRCQDVDDGSGIPKQNVVACLPPAGGTARGGLMLAGHLDTVPFSEDQKATTTPRIERGKLFGRGACDMKGGVAACIAAAGRFQDTALRYPLHLVFTCNEEIGMHGARALSSLPDLSPDFAIVAEPTELKPVRAHKAYWGAEVTFHGVPCHSADPSAGVDALKPAVAALVELDALAREVAAVVPQGAVGLFAPPHATMNVGRLEAGTARNVVPGVASFTLELRALPGQDPGAIFARAEAIVRRAASAHAVKVSFVVDQRDEPMFTPATSPLVRYLEVIAGAPASGVSYSTEGHIYHAMGMETVIFGPGSIRRAHRPDEFVPTRDLRRATDVLATAIQRFCVG